jgi:hypothetical protein
MDDEEKLSRLREAEKNNPNRLKIVRIMEFLRRNMGALALNPPETEAKTIIDELKLIVNQ